MTGGDGGTTPDLVENGEMTVLTGDCVKVSRVTKYGCFMKGERFH